MSIGLEKEGKQPDINTDDLSMPLCLMFFFMRKGLSSEERNKKVHKIVRYWARK